MNAVRNLALLVVSGGLAGTWVGALVARSVVPWYNTPSTGVLANCDCHALTLSTLAGMTRVELIGLALGALSFLVLGLVLGVGRSRRPTKDAPASPPDRGA